MRFPFPIIQKLLVLSMLFHGNLSVGQFSPIGDVVDQMIQDRVPAPIFPTMINHQLLVESWASYSQGRNPGGDLALRFEPVNDQNVYLLYRYELDNKRSKAEVGFSVNRFNALSLKFTQLFSLTKSVKKHTICLK